MGTTITDRTIPTCSAPGASRRTSRSRWRGCGKRCVSCQGVIYNSDAPQRRAVLQVVGRRVDISLQEEWGERAPRTQIVAIGAVGSIDANLLKKTFASCISSTVAAESSRFSL